MRRACLLVLALFGTVAVSQTDVFVFEWPSDAQTCATGRVRMLKLLKNKQCYQLDQTTWFQFKCISSTEAGYGVFTDAACTTPAGPSSGVGVSSGPSGTPSGTGASGTGGPSGTGGGSGTGASGTGASGTGASGTGGGPSGTGGASGTTAGGGATTAG